MRNFKKFLSLVLACMMLLSATAFSVGAKEDDYTEAASNLVAIGLLKGDGNGNLMLDKSVTRYQAALFFVQAITGKTDPAVWNADKSAIFSDVPEYGTAIDYLAGLGLIKGRGNGIYGYNDPVTYQDMLTIAVRALGYETKDMVYPYGHIATAQKLGLTENISSVNFKAEMTRGETAQLIWDLLDTEIAITDPISGEIIYPGKEDESAYGIILGPGKIKRETYLEKAGFASGRLTFVIKGFTEAKNDEEVDTLTVEYDGKQYDIVASDLGITSKTAKIDYLGLPVSVYVNCKADEFFSKYSTDSEESEARIVLVNKDTLSFIENLDDGGNIRVYDKHITLGGVKYAFDKYEIAVHTFTEDGWKATDASTFKANFAYTDKDGYKGANSNGALRYIVRESESEGKTIKTLHIYYMPYSFGQYFERELKDSTTGKNASFVTIGSYESVKVENKDKELSHFVEYLLGTSSKVSASTTTVSKRNGEKAKSAVLAGEKIKSGDFMYYYYNSLDNILTVAKNHGGFRHGQLTGTSSAKETVKISGTNFEVGFKGGFSATYSSYAANKALIETLMKSYEAGTDNVKYVVVGGNVVYMEEFKGESGKGTDGFAVVSLDKTVIAKLLGTTLEKLDLTEGFVLDKEGRVTVALLNTESGKWELRGIEMMHKGYNTESGKYEISGDIGSYATYVSLVGESFAKHADFVALKGALANGGVFALIEDDGEGIEIGTAEGAVEYGTTTEGIIFSDVTNKTNKLTATADGESARVSLDDDSIIVIVDALGNVGVRHGIQKAKYTVAGNAKVFAAGSGLIVAVFEEPTFNGGFENVTKWGESVSAVTEETYYVALPTSSVSIDTAEEGVAEKFKITVTNLLDLRTLTVVSERVFYSNTVTSIDLAKALYADEHGVITHADKTIGEAFKAARLLEGAKNEMSFVEIAPENLNFTDGDTVSVSGGALTLPGVLAGINATVVTIDATGLDRETYDFDRLAVNVPFNAEGGLGGSELEITDGVYGYYYPLHGDMVEEIHEPTEGVLDQFIINSVGKDILVPLTDTDNYDSAVKITVELKIMASYDEDTGILTMSVAKILK
nr:S-layer homology domain-containing protein [Clostridia bacterium]